MRLILASGSPRRRELISILGIPFEVIKSDIDETQHPGEAPFAYVERLSIEKAQAVAQKIDESVPILAADTIVVLVADGNGVDEQGEILGKPENADDARHMLKRLRGRAHLVCTAITVLQHGDTSKQITQRTVTTVTMRDYSDAEIDAYIASGDPFDKAGSYAIQNETFAPVAHIDGDYNNVVGLPLEVVKHILKQFGFALD
jgi:septum formation protein